jgi:dihydroflavonol-4-reductase
VNVFITGATGFVGSRLVERLSEDNHKIICLVRETSEVRSLEEAGASLIMGDICDKAAVLSGMKDCQWIVHLANVYSFWEPNPQIYYKVNVEGTRNVMVCALETGVLKIVHVSTYGAYGHTEDAPFTEDCSPGPRSCEYAETKYLADQIVWDLFKTRNLPVTVLYPANILGAGDEKATGEYIKNIIYHRLPARVLENHFFTVVHVFDVINAIIQALYKKDNIGEKYLVGKYYLTFRDFNRIISTISGVPLPRLSLPDALVVMSASLLTFIADRVKKPPIYGMSNGQVGAMLSDARCCGIKAERELGIAYTPIQIAIEEAITSYLEQ